METRHQTPNELAGAVDHGAEHGFGVVTVRFDDGRRLSVALVGDTGSMFLPAD